MLGFAAALTPRLLGNSIPGHTMRVPPAAGPRYANVSGGKGRVRIGQGLEVDIRIECSAVYTLRCLFMLESRAEIINVSYRIVHSSEYKVTVMPVTKLRQTGRSRRTRPRRAAAVTGTVGPTPVRGGAADGGPGLGPTGRLADFLIEVNLSAPA